MVSRRRAMESTKSACLLLVQVRMTEPLNPARPCMRHRVVLAFRIRAMEHNVRRDA